MSNDDLFDELGRPTQDVTQGALFDMAPDWRHVWWGMPEFEMRDARPGHKLVVNFMTAEDMAAFAQRSGLPVTTTSDSVWFPHQTPLRGQFVYCGPKTDSRYPVCIPSKGRADCQTTGHALQKMGVTHRFFVEDTEYEAYCRSVGEARVVKMPFHDLGLGSIPARNFIWDWALENGHARHWVVDDNIRAFARCHVNRRLNVEGGGFFLAMEDFVDRHENVALAGPHDKGFVPDRNPELTPFLLNSRVYSCILIDSQLKHRWRGRYNEDTDLSLRCLKDGLTTILFRALIMDKGVTSGSRGGKPLPGGNTDNVYNSGDHRRAFAESLRDQHPDCVKVVWKFNRWHHEVDYSRFRNNPLRLRAGVVPTANTNDYGMRLIRTSAAVGHITGQENDAAAAIEEAA